MPAGHQIARFKQAVEHEVAGLKRLHEADTLAGCKEMPDMLILVDCTKQSTRMPQSCGAGCVDCMCCSVSGGITMPNVQAALHSAAESAMRGCGCFRCAVNTPAALNNGAGSAARPGMLRAHHFTTGKLTSVPHPLLQLLS